MVGTTYGSIEDSNTIAASIDPEVEKADASPAVDDPYDSEQTYYLKDTRPWTSQRIWNLFLPLLVAVLLVGGAALFLLRDFGTLYPGQGNSGADTSRSIPIASGSTTYSDKTFPTIDDKNSNSDNDQSSRSRDKIAEHHSSERNYITSKDDIGASCNLHPDCSMLIGRCCPTFDGKMLECCT